MKKTFKKALSIVLSLALTVMCLTGAFVSASAETTTPEKMLKITPQIAGDAVSFRQQTLTQGHTYKLKMLQNGITGVQAFSTSPDWVQSSNTVATIGSEDDYTTYTFTCVYPRTRLLFITESAGTSGYMADIKLYDTTNNTDAGIDFTTMTFEYSSVTYSNWLVDRTDASSYSSDILDSAIAGINFIELLNFDATVFENDEEPQQPVEPEEPANLEKMLEITPQVAGDAVSFRQQQLTTGHSYKLKMLQSGITGVIPRERVNWTYVNTSAVAGTEGDYTTYTFTCAGDRTRLLFTTEAAGTSGYMADIKLYDTTSGTEVNIDFTTMTFEYNSDTYSNWLVDRTDPQSFSDDILNDSIANINFIELLDFDATVFETPEEPQQPEEPEEPVNLEKMLEITPQVAGDAVSFRQQNLVAGHTYKLKMIQKGITSVIPYTTDFATYTQTPVTVGTEGKYTTYTFNCIYTRNRFLFTTESAGTSGYIADVKLFDVTSNEYVEISFTTMTFEYNSDTYSNWLIQRPDVTSYSSDILNADIANINFIALLDYDETVFETPEEPEEPVNLEKMLKITPQVAGDAVSFRQQNLVPGHTYKLKMLQKGITGVIPRERVKVASEWDYVNTPAVAGTEGDYTTYTFTCAGDRTRLLFTTESAGTSGYIADVKLFDVTSNEYVEISFTTMTFEYNSDTYSNWLVDPTVASSYSLDILNSDIAGINFIELFYYDEKCFLNLGDYNNDGIVNILDLIRLKKFAVGQEVTVNDKMFVTDGTELASELVYAIKLLLGFTYADFEILVNAPAASMQYSGGAEAAATAMKKQIYNTDDSLDIAGNTYYVSADGSSTASGTRNDPISVDAVNSLSLSSGDAVLFRRGDTFRLSESINMVSGVTYGAYGEGKKPELYGSLKNYAKVQWYQKSGNIWQTDLDVEDVGVMVFNNGDSVGVKQDTESRLTSNGDYMNDTVWNVLYLYCEGYPSLVYDSIELATTESVLYGHAVSNVTVDNLSIKYTGAHALDFHADYPSNETSNVTVTNCEIGWGGGFWFTTTGTGHGEQYGNGIEFYGPAQSINVNNCYIYQQFDAGVTFQENGYVDYKNITFDSNNIEYCSYNIEFFNGGEDGVINHLNEGYYRNISITNNILRFAGYGFGSNRPHAHGVAHITCWDVTFTKSHTSFTITGNILDCSANNLIYWPNAQSTANITASGNTFYQKANPIDYTSLYHVDQNAPGYTANASLNIGTQQSVTGNTPADKQSSFTSQMALFESGTTNAFWLEN